MSLLRQPWAIAIALLAGCAGPPAPQATPEVEPAASSTGTTAAVVGDDMTLYAGDQPLARFAAVYLR